ncbi:S8 family serine peptidase [Bergeyella sp. RCAD1439]|uniref:S8 family serine peptidase n=1 Tax=Bergeyella anatis TaxID=3113737 RepID=UPI002E18D994|nr:S8 family serine peptidase [Bergeyella sp. RCAD1439]
MNKLNYSKKIGVALCAFLGVGIFAQTQQDVREIQKKSNLSELDKVKKELLRSRPTQAKIESLAKEYNLKKRFEFEGKIYELQDVNKKTGHPLYYVTANSGAAQGTETDKLYESAGIFNLEGQDLTLYEWDGGAVLLTHQELQGRVVQADGATVVSDHATHVAGTMIGAGVNAAAKGMAFRGKLQANDWNMDATEVTTAAAAGALVSNHSYGYNSGFTWNNASGNTGWHWYGSDEDTEFKYYGKYTTYDRDWDRIAYNAPYYLLVKAAGNPRGEGPAPGGLHYVRVFNGTSWVWQTSSKTRQVNGGEFGFDSINHSSLGKNILTVGAVKKLNQYNGPSDVEMSSFSGFGPVDDGRVKPDIVGVGVDVYSSVGTGNVAYDSYDGTSMASPNVSGSIGLLQQHYRNVNGSYMRSATLKALVLNTAKEAGNIGPDYAYGWGLLDAFKAAQTISTHGKLSLVDEHTLNPGETQTIDLTADGKVPLKAMIVWTDPAPTTLPNEAVLNDRTKTLVNDLDIKILKNGNEFKPWVLDPEHPNNPATKGDNVVDNVEQVVIDTPEAGAVYQLVVSHKGELKGDQAQAFSLVVTGINQNLAHDLALNKIYTNQTVENYTDSTPVIFNYENKGAEVINGAKINYKLINKDDGNSVVSEGTIDIDNLAPGTAVDKEVLMDFSRSFVNYEIMAEVAYAQDEISVNNRASFRTFGTVANLTVPNSKHGFGFEKDFATYGWASEDVDGDGRTWRKYDDTRFSRTGASFAINWPNQGEGTNDWLFSNPLKLKGGKPYRVVFFDRKLQPFDEKLNVAFGTSPKAVDMTKPITSESVVAGPNYTKRSYIFTPDSDGIYYVGFQNKAEADQKSYAFLLDDVSFYYVEESAPAVEFSANKTTTHKYGDTVTFSQQVEGPSGVPSTYKWSFTPSTYQFVNGTNDSSENPQVQFSENGTYTARLEASNSFGSNVLEKANHINVTSTNATAAFTLNTYNIYKGQSVTASNTSVGYPAPAFQWTVTPSDQVEFINGTSATSTNPQIKFGKVGAYKVTLTSTSPVNSVVKTVDVNVEETHKPVKDLTYDLNQDTKELKLKWVRPQMVPAYIQGFEAGETLSSVLGNYDVDGDNEKWYVNKVAGNTRSGLYSAKSDSWTIARRAFTANNWLVTEKIKSGAEQLSFWVKHMFPERYSVYLVEAKADGTMPTKEEVQQGTKIYDFPASGERKAFTNVIVDLSGYNQKEMHLAFVHNTKKEDNGFYLILDDIEIGYKDPYSNTSKVAKEVREPEGPQELRPDNPKELVYVAPEEPVVASEGYVTTAVNDLPSLIGFEVSKDGTLVQELQGIAKTAYNETLQNKGVYQYGVKAVYSDGARSEEVVITVDASTLSVSDVSGFGKGLKVYPNPSDGLFVVENVGVSGKQQFTVYDMSGKLVESKSSDEAKTSLDLRKYPKGVYILNVVDSSNGKQSVKLMVK